MSDNCEVPQNDPHAKNGYTFDAFAAECQRIPIYPGLPVTYRWLHVGEIAFTAAATHDPTYSATCPPMWRDVEPVWQTSYAAGLKAADLIVADTITPATLPLVTIDPRIGTTVDPFSGPEYMVDIHDARIPYHTKRQQEVSHIARQEGAVALTLTTIPPCPPLFQDVEHYWKTSSIAGFESTHSSTWIRFKAFLENEFLTKDGRLDQQSTALKVLIGAATSFPVWYPAIKPIAATFGIALP